MFAHSLFGGAAPSIDPAFAALRRLALDPTAWVDVQESWLAGDETLFDVLAGTTSWTSPVVRMYDNDVATPRLNGRIDPAVHPVVGDAMAALTAHYGVRLDRVSANLYRNGDDSVAWHGDRIARQRPEAIVATVSLGAPRRFLLRPRGGGRSVALSLGHGDLVVMGGSCQRTWQHAVPKTAYAAPRIALMFRHRYD